MASWRACHCIRAHHGQPTPGPSDPSEGGARPRREGGGQHLRQPDAVRQGRGSCQLPAHPGAGLRRPGGRRCRHGVHADPGDHVPAGAGEPDLRRGTGSLQPAGRGAAPGPLPRRQHCGHQAVQPGTAGRGLLRPEGLPATGAHSQDGGRHGDAHRDRRRAHGAGRRRAGTLFAQRLSDRCRARHRSRAGAYHELDCRADRRGR